MNELEIDKFAQPSQQWFDAIGYDIGSSESFSNQFMRGLGFVKISVGCRKCCCSIHVGTGNHGIGLHSVET